MTLLPRRFRLNLGLGLLSFFLTAGCLYSPDEAKPDSSEVKILFIGSSYFAAHDMVGHFRRLAEEGEHEIYLGSFIRSGLYLDDLAREPQVAAKIRQEKWDYVILQGVGRTTAYPENHHLLTSNSSYHPVFPALQDFKRMVVNNCDATTLIFQMPFAFEDGMLWAGMSDDYFDMQELCYTNTLAWADSLDLGVAPVGWAWRTILLSEPGVHYLHASDWNHPSLRGSYLNASVFYATVFGESCAGLEYRAGLPTAEAHQLRQVGSTTVLGDRELWNLPR